MEILNSGDPVDLWELKDNPRKLHIGYGVCLNLSTLLSLGIGGVHHCFVGDCIPFVPRTNTL